MQGPGSSGQDNEAKDKVYFSFLWIFFCIIPGVLEDFPFHIIPGLLEHVFCIIPRVLAVWRNLLSGDGAEIYHICCG